MITESSILIVDDDPHLRKTLSDILKAKGYVTMIAAQGKTALAKVEHEKPAVALIDLKLPDMDGLELVREIKRRSPSPECVVLTGHASQSSAIEAINLGAYSYLQKPYDMEQLLVTIRRAVEKWEAEDALRESEERFRLLFDRVFDAVVMLDEQRQITDVNEAACRLLGYTRQELCRLCAQDIHPPGEMGKIRAAIDRVLANGVD